MMQAAYISSSTGSVVCDLQSSSATRSYQACQPMLFLAGRLQSYTIYYTSGHFS